MARAIMIQKLFANRTDRDRTDRYDADCEDTDIEGVWSENALRRCTMVYCYWLLKLCLSLQAAAAGVQPGMI